MNEKADLEILHLLKQNAAMAMSPALIQSMLRKNSAISEVERRLAVLRLAEQGKIRIRADRQIELIK